MTRVFYSWGDAQERGAALFKAEKWPEAIAEFTEAIKRNPKFKAKLYNVLIMMMMVSCFILKNMHVFLFNSL